MNKRNELYVWMNKKNIKKAINSFLFIQNKILAYALLKAIIINGIGERPGNIFIYSNSNSSTTIKAMPHGTNNALLSIIYAQM